MDILALLISNLLSQTGQGRKQADWDADFSMTGWNICTPTPEVGVVSLEIDFTLKSKLL